MPVSIAQKIKIADRRAKVAHLKLTEPNLSSYAIAERIGGKWTHQTVLNDLSSIEEEWKQSSVLDFNKAKAIQLARMEKIYDELWVAWEKSKTDAVSVIKHRTKVEVKPKKGKKAKSRMLDDSEDIRREHQCGDPRYMKLLMENVQMQCDLFGISVKGKDELPSTPQIVSFNLIVPSTAVEQQVPKQVEMVMPNGQQLNGEHKQANDESDHVEFDNGSDGNEESGL